MALVKQKRALSGAFFFGSLGRVFPHLDLPNDHRILLTGGPVPPMVVHPPVQRLYASAPVPWSAPLCIRSDPGAGYFRCTVSPRRSASTVSPGRSADRTGADCGR